MMTLQIGSLAALGGFPGVALIVFVVVFVATVGYVLIVPKPIWQRDAELPLKDPTTAPQRKEANNA